MNSVERFRSKGKTPRSGHCWLYTFAKANIKPEPKESCAAALSLYSSTDSESATENFIPVAPSRLNQKQLFLHP